MGVPPSTGVENAVVEVVHWRLRVVGAFVRRRDVERLIVDGVTAVIETATLSAKHEPDNSSVDRLNPRLHLARGALLRDSSDGVRLFAPLHIAHRAERQVVAQRPEIFKHRPRPPQCVSDQRDHGEWKPQVGLALLLQREDASHEELEDDEGPKQAVEGKSPGLAV